MNETAEDIGAFDTVAGTPSGLDVAGQSSSPYDLALIFRALLATRHRGGADHAHRADAPRSRAAPPATRSRTRTRCCRRYPGDLGGKTGFTDAARHTFVTAAERDGRRLVVSVMDTENTPAARRRPGGPAARLGLRRAGRHRGVGTLVARRGRRLAAPGGLDHAAGRRPGRRLRRGRGAVDGPAPGRPGRARRRRRPDRRRDRGRPPAGQAGTGAASRERTATPARPAEGRRPRRREEAEAGHQVDPHEQAHGTAEGRRRHAAGDQREVVAADQLQHLEPGRAEQRARAGAAAAGRRSRARPAAATGR